VTLDGITKIYPNGTTAVDRLYLDIGDGELVVLLGPSGCGKTTVLRTIAGLEQVSAGEVRLGGRVANGVPPNRRDVAMVFQDCALYPHLSVRDNLAFPLRVGRRTAGEVDERVADIAGSLGIADILERAPKTLSGGQRQRVAMGRAIIRQPAVFLLDEPLSHLDAGLRAELRAEMATLVRSLGVTTVYVTHDQTEALTIADRIAVLRRGVLEDVGSPYEIYEDPATIFVAAFLTAPRLNLVHATVRVNNATGVELELGGPRLTLPWSDPRTAHLAPHHNEKIIVGVRPDDVSLAVRGSDPAAVTGRVRFVEYLGGSAYAHLDTCLDAIPAAWFTDEADVAPPPPPARRGRRLARAIGAHMGRPRRAVAEAVNGSQRLGLHQEGRADVIVRLRDRPQWMVDTTMTVTIDPRRVYLFGLDGRRVDPAQRSRKNVSRLRSSSALSTRLGYPDRLR
jgi:multiple sugar transport system ATP-binding protein